MITSFTRNDDAARHADSPAGISKSGAYTGTITQCAVFETQNKATGVELAFKTDEGVMCFTTLYILSKTGERTFNHDIFDALMTVANVEQAPVVQMKVYERDGKVSTTKFHRVPALERVHIGLILQRENYVNLQGRPSYRMNVVTAFDPQTKRLAKEILAGEIEPKLFAERLRNLKDRDAKPSTTAQTQAPDMPPEPPAEDYPF